MDWQRADRFESLLIVASALGVAGLLGACASTRTTREGAVRWVEPPAATGSYETSAPQGDAVLGPHAEIVRGVLAESADGLQGDPRLAQLGAWIAEQTGDEAGTPPQRGTDMAARALGLVEPTPHFVVLGTGDAGAIAEGVRGQLQRLLSEHSYSHYGAFTRSDARGHLVVVVLGFRFVALDAMPRELPLGAAIQLRGTLSPGYSAPELAVTRPEGPVDRIALGNGPRLASAYATSTAGTYRVELLAQGPRGVTVVANFPVYVGTEAPRRIEVPATADETSGDPVAHMLARINEERAKAGAAALQLHDAASGVALAHVEDMLASGFVAHDSPNTGSAVDRVQRAGIRTPLVLENIGRGYSLREVHEGLMSSPGHRSNILLPQATHVGIGVVVRADHGATSYLVTELFIRIPPALQDDADDALLAGINRQRARRRLTDLKVDSALSEVAQDGARAYCTSGTPSEAKVMQDVQRALQRSKARGQRIGAVLTLASDLNDLETVDAVIAADPRSIGIGLAQGNRKDAFPAAICALLLLAQ
jgi:uncharacterized protein YkwD